MGSSFSELARGCTGRITSVVGAVVAGFYWMRYLMARGEEEFLCILVYCGCEWLMNDLRKRSKGL